MHFLFVFHQVCMFFFFLNQSLNSRKALLPRVMSEDSLSLKEHCSNCLFMSSLDSEVWKKNPTEYGELVYLFVMSQFSQCHLLLCSVRWLE